MVRQNNDFPRSVDTEGRRESSDAMRLGRLSESAKDCRLAKMAAAESAGCGLSIPTCEPIATIETKMSIANAARMQSLGAWDSGCPIHSPKNRRAYFRRNDAGCTNSGFTRPRGLVGRTSCDVSTGENGLEESSDRMSEEFTLATVAGSSGRRSSGWLR